jgi:signal transduction histidine kinase
MSKIAPGPNLSPETTSLLLQWGWNLDSTAPVTVDAVSDALELRSTSAPLTEDRLYFPIEAKEHEFRWRVEACHSRLQRFSNRLHELRSPLNAIQGYAEMIIETADGDTLRFASNIRTAAELLTARLESFRKEGV